MFGGAIQIILLLSGQALAQTQPPQPNSEQARQGETQCCREGRCTDAYMHSLTRNAGRGESNATDPCAAGLQASRGSTALYASAATYTVQASACTSACVASGTGFGAATGGYCEYYNYASGAVDTMLTYAVTRSGPQGEQIANNVQSMATNLGSRQGSGGSNSREQQGQNRAASCMRAVTASAMATQKYMSAGAAAASARRSYSQKIEVLNRDGGNRLSGFNGNSQPDGLNSAATEHRGNTSGGTSGPHSTPPSVLPSRDFTFAQQIIPPGMDDYLKNTAGISMDNLMNAMADGMTPSQALAALSGSQVGSDALQVIQAGEMLAAAAKMTPEEAARLEPANHPQVPAFAYTAARGPGGASGDGTDDIMNMMAGLMDQLNPQKQKEGARGPGAAGTQFGRGPAGDRLVGVHYLTPGDETTIFELMNRSYTRVIPRLFGGAAPGTSESAPSQSQNLPTNPYLRGGAHP